MEVILRDNFQDDDPENFAMGPDEFFDFCDLTHTRFEADVTREEFDDGEPYLNITSKVTGRTFYGISRYHLLPVTPSTTA